MAEIGDVVRWRHPHGHEMQGVLRDIKDGDFDFYGHKMAVVDVIPEFVSPKWPPKEDGETWVGRYIIRLDSVTPLSR